MKSWKKNGREMYSTHNGWKSVIAERFIWILKNKNYKCMTSKKYINTIIHIIAELKWNLLM